MKLKTACLLSFFSILLLFTPTHAIPRITFSHIGTDQGLSQSSVFDVTQDRLGFMWMATADGLNRYDGYGFKTYHNLPRDRFSIGSDIIKTVMIDRQGRLWIGTNAGLSLYDDLHDCFFNFRTDRKMSVSHIVELGNNQLLICANGHLWVFDTVRRTFQKAQIVSSPMGEVTAIDRSKHTVFIGTASGLYAYDMRKHTTYPLAAHELAGKRVSVTACHGPNLWIGTEGNGLYQLRLTTLKISRYTPTNSLLCSNYIRALAYDKHGNLWIGTVNGLNVLDHQGNMTVYKAQPLVEESLSQASVRCLYADAQGGMWVGTYFGGINYYHPRKHRFSYLRMIPGQNTIHNNIIGCIVEDAKRNLWIGTNDGISYYYAVKQRYETITSTDGLASNDIKDIYVDPHSGTAFVGSQLGGLAIIRQHPRRVKNVVISDISPDANSVYAILPYKNNCELLLGTLDGLKCFDILSQKITSPKVAFSAPLTSEQRKIRALHRDHAGRLWVGTEGGLFVLRPTAKGFRQLFPTKISHTLGRAFVLCVVETPDRKVWLGTRQGAFCVDPATWQVRRYSVSNTLPSNIVCGIIQDAGGTLWLSTGNGLCRLNQKTGKTRVYTHTDGIQSNQFSPHAFCQTQDGRLLFGGVNGITAFNPRQLKDNPYAPRVVITTLRVFNQPVVPGDHHDILNRQLPFTRHITLTHQQTMFSLQFVVPNYIAGSHNTFVYMLEGYDQKWHYTNDMQTVSYSRLPAGTYLFKVKAANNDGKWCAQPTELEIEVLPVWYATWWARLIFLFAIIGVVILGFRHLLSRKMVQLQLENERQDKLRMQEINEMKQRFFIDISHELRTPLTLIISPLQEMKERLTDTWAQQQLTIMRRNVNRLLHLVNQLMDYRRAELGYFKLQVRPVDLQQMIERLFEQFEKLAQQREIGYQLIADLKEEHVVCDPNFIELMMNNLLSNAFKFTPKGGNIAVKAELTMDSEAPKTLILQVSDTGKGIPEDQHARIFERFYQTEAMHEGSGVGLSLVKRLVTAHHGTIHLESQMGQGSTFTICLPAEKSAYQPNELAAEQAVVQTYSINSPMAFMADSLENEMEEETTEVGIAAETSGHETLLIVEDNEDIRLHLCQALRRNYQIIEAADGIEATEKLASETISLVLTDIMMPRMDGLQLCRHIKQHIQTSHIPVIILSAKVEVEEQLDGLRIGADDYIIKPFSIAIVKAKIQNALRIRKTTIEHYTKTQQIVPKEITNNALDEELLSRAIEIVNQNLCNTDFSTERFAREMLMSRSNLHLKLKALTGESTNDFIRRIRFNKACALLKEGRLSISEISYKVGFNSPSYFATSFKKRFGCMPTEYGKQPEDVQP